MMVSSAALCRLFGLVEFELCLHPFSHRLIEPRKPPVNVHVVRNSARRHLQFAHGIFSPPGIRIQNSEVEVGAFHIADRS